MRINYLTGVLLSYESSQSLWINQIIILTFLTLISFISYNTYCKRKYNPFTNHINPILLGFMTISGKVLWLSAFLLFGLLPSRNEHPNIFTSYTCLLPCYFWKFHPQGINISYFGIATLKEQRIGSIYIHTHISYILGLLHSRNNALFYLSFLILGMLPSRNGIAKIIF